MAAPTAENLACASGQEAIPTEVGYLCGPADLADPASQLAKAAAPVVGPVGQGGPTPALSGGPTPVPEPAPASSPATAGWRLVWNDEFNGSTVDTAKWNVLNNSTFGDGNNELACLMAENVTQAGGYLTIRARKLDVPKLCGSRDARFPEGRSYTSGFVETKGKASFTYGRFEVRFRAPTGAGTSKGLWPAFWMRPNDGGLGEIDVLEIVGTGQSEKANANKMSQTLWYDYRGTHPKQVNVFRLPGDTYDTAFRTAAVEWEPGAIRWYVDGALTYERTRATTPWIDEAFSRDFFLRLNMAVGGGWPGSPDTVTQFPAEYVLDYVRVYQR